MTAPSSLHFAPFRALLRVCLALAGCTLALSARATTVVPPDFPTLVNGSDYIVRVVVTDVAAEKRAGVRGTKIYTQVEFETLEVIAGSPPPRVVLDFLGGRVGDEQLSVGGMPRFRVGDEDILFVSGNGRTICPLYAMNHGRFPVAKDANSGRRYVVRADGMPLQSVADSATPLAEDGARPRAASAAGLAPEEFVRQIRATRQSQARP